MSRVMSLRRLSEHTNDNAEKSGKLWHIVMTLSLFGFVLGGKRRNGQRQNYRFPLVAVFGHERDRVRHSRQPLHAAVGEQAALPLASGDLRRPALHPPLERAVRLRRACRAVMLLARWKLGGHGTASDGCDAWLSYRTAFAPMPRSSLKHGLMLRPIMERRRVEIRAGRPDNRVNLWIKTHLRE